MQADQLTHSPIQAAVQILTFDPGMYSLTFGAERSVESDVGFVFPRARLDAPASGPGLIVVALKGENGWLVQPGDTAMIQVTGARMCLLLTTYQIEGANAAPLLRVNRIADFRAQDPVAPAAATPVPATPVGPVVSGIVHVGGQGDVSLRTDGWAGASRESGSTVEGFIINAPAGLDPMEVEYQGMLGIDWTTPWTRAGEFCGSRGLALPLLGFTVRLGAKAGAAIGCTYRARFQDGSVVEAADGAVCASPSGTAIEAIWVFWTPRAAAVPSGAAQSTRAVMDAQMAPKTVAGLVTGAPERATTSRMTKTPIAAVESRPAPKKSKASTAPKKATAPRATKAPLTSAKSRPTPEKGKVSKNVAKTRGTTAARKPSRTGRSR